MDEPCSALDPIATARVEDLMLELRNEYTIIVVTHNMQQAARVSDRTGVLHRPPRRDDRQPHRPARGVRPHLDDLLQPQRQAHRGLHLRPLRLSRLGPVVRRGGPERPGCPIGGSDPQGVPGHPAAGYLRTPWTESAPFAVHHVLRYLARVLWKSRAGVVSFAARCRCGLGPMDCGCLARARDRAARRSATRSVVAGAPGPARRRRPERLGNPLRSVAASRLQLVGPLRHRPG